MTRFYTYNVITLVLVMSDITTTKTQLYLICNNYDAYLCVITLSVIYFYTFNYYSRITVSKTQHVDTTEKDRKKTHLVFIFLVPRQACRRRTTFVYWSRSLRSPRSSVLELLVLTWSWHFFPINFNTNSYLSLVRKIS